MKSQPRIRKFFFLGACTLLLALSSCVIGQEAIGPEILIGDFQTQEVELDTIPEDAIPDQEPTLIRSLPPAPGPTNSPGNPVTQATPSTSFAPNVPDLGLPGQSLPSQEYYDLNATSPQALNSEFITPLPPRQIPPNAFSQQPVVAPHGFRSAGNQARTPKFNPEFSIGQGDYNFDRSFTHSHALGPAESAVLNEGFRSTTPTVRGGPLDDYGQEFEFENKKREYPPFSEIMKTGRYFGNAELLYLKPYFQNNTAITVEGPNTGFSKTFDFGYDAGNRFLIGFESKYGPGAELNYFQYDHQSRPSVFTSSGGFHGESATWMAGPGRWTRLRTANDGDRLTTSHSLEVQNLGVSFFKDWKLPIAKLGGGFGIQYVSIEQDLQSRLFDGTGAEIGSLSARHELRAFGPKFEFKYFRPVGHTKLDIIGGFSGAVLFGNRDQSVFNTATSDTSRVGADEFLMVFDVIAGLQYSHNYADNRSFYARVSLMSQAWLGGGTAMLPQDDLGFRGVGFAVGFNR